MTFIPNNDVPEEDEELQACQGWWFEDRTVVLCGRTASEFPSANLWLRHLRKCMKRRRELEKTGWTLGAVDAEILPPANPFRSESRAYSNAIQRCTDPMHPYFARYGGRGIEFRFKSFDEFIQHIGAKPSANLSLDRINNDGHYEIGNVRWATQEQQLANRSLKWHQDVTPPVAQIIEGLAC